MSFKVEIKHRATGAVELSLKAKTKSEAERLKRGMQINLNHAEYMVEIKDESGKP